MGRESRWAIVVYPLKESNNSEQQERDKWQGQNDVTCYYGNLVPMATEICLHRFAADSIQTLCLEHMSPGL